MFLSDSISPYHDRCHQDLDNRHNKNAQQNIAEQKKKDIERTEAVIRRRRKHIPAENTLPGIEQIIVCPTLPSPYTYCCLVFTRFFAGMELTSSKAPNASRIRIKIAL